MANMVGANVLIKVVVEVVMVEAAEVVKLIVEVLLQALVWWN